ncbi:MAG: MFS transporter [Bacteriovoracaceae bacterium]|nr:MFS transporter [Bacteriovoracaceae bacterium]
MNSFWLISLSGFFVLAGYNFIRSVSVPVFIEMFGKGRIIEAQAVMGVALVVTLYLYNLMLSKLGPKKTLFFTQLFFAIFFSLGTLAAIYKIGPIIYAINVFKEIYIVMIVEQIWSYFNSTFHGKKHKLYVGIMTGVASFGPILSGFGASWISDHWHPYALFFLTGVFLLPSLLFMNIAYRHQPVDEIKSTKVEKFGIKEFHRFPILKLLFILVVFSQVLGTLSMLNFQIHMADQFPDVAKQTSEYGSFYSYINLYAGIFQFFAAPLLLKFLAPGYLLLIVILANCGLQYFAFFSPSFSLIMYSALFFKSLDYSLFRCVKETFYESLTYDARFRSKQLIDVFGYRMAGSLFNTVLGVVKVSIPAIEQFLPIMGVATATGWLFSFAFLARRFGVLKR